MQAIQKWFYFLTSHQFNQVNHAQSQNETARVGERAAEVRLWPGRGLAPVRLYPPAHEPQEIRQNPPARPLIA